MGTPEFGAGLPGTVAEARTSLQAGALSSVELCEALLERIRSQNDRIRAVRTVFKDRVLEDAVHLDRQRNQGDVMGALTGIPVLVKENIDILPGPSSAGLEFLRARVPTRDAWIVERLRNAGALILGTTVSDPGAFGVRTAYVRHPMNPALTVGGSSGGSAAALAAGFAYAALGTDTGGSIRIPSACCGTVGLKPTFGSWNTQGVYPLVRDLDHVGPMARTVEDLTEVWTALMPVASPRTSPRAPLRFGWCPEWLAFAQPDVQFVFHRVLRHLADQGHHLAQVQLPRLEDVSRVHFTHFCHAVCQLHLDEFGHTPDMFGLEAQEAFRAGRKLSGRELQQVEDLRKNLKAQVDHALVAVDLLVLPTLPVHKPELAAETFQVGGRPMSFTAALVYFSSLFNHTGHPVLTTPAPGTIPTALHSVQWAGPWGAESLLLGAVARVLTESS